MTKGTTDYNLGVIWITMLTVQIINSGNMGLMSCLDQGDLPCLNALVMRTIYSKMSSARAMIIALKDAHSGQNSKAKCQIVFE